MAVEFAEHGLEKVNTQKTSFVQNQPQNKNKTWNLHTVVSIYIFIHILKRFFACAWPEDYFISWFRKRKLLSLLLGNILSVQIRHFAPFRSEMVTSVADGFSNLRQKYFAKTRFCLILFFYWMLTYRLVTCMWFYIGHFNDFRAETYILVVEF